MRKVLTVSMHCLDHYVKEFQDCLFVSQRRAGPTMYNEKMMNSNDPGTQIDDHVMVAHVKRDRSQSVVGIFRFCNPHRRLPHSLKCR